MPKKRKLRSTVVPIHSRMRATVHAQRVLEMSPTFRQYGTQERILTGHKREFYDALVRRDSCVLTA